MTLPLVNLSNRHADGRFTQQQRLVVAVVIALVALPGGATTPAEDRIKKMPMPHASLGKSDAMVKVHLARLDGYVEGRPDNAANLSKLEALVQSCVKQAQESGKPVNPPRTWPDFINSLRTDEYSTANRSIRFSFGVAYGVNQSDCSLLEIERAGATLNSSKGTCEINLLEKTAHGDCDPAAHANAQAHVRAAPSSIAEVEAAQRKTPNNPALAALAAVMKLQPPGGTGLHKTVLGLECAVWKNPFDPDGTVCLSLGGSFVAHHATGEQNHSSMTLEMTSVAGIKMRAVEAKLDTLVNSAVFAPHLAGGFRITRKAERK